MRNWTIATLVAVIILTSPFTLVGMSIIGGVIVYGPGYLEIMQTAVETEFYDDRDVPTRFTSGDDE
jgi:hypothetical protein